MKKILFRFMAGPAKFRVMRAWGEFFMSASPDHPEFKSATLTTANGRVFEFSSLDDIQEAAKLLTEMIGRWKADKHELQTKKTIDYIAPSGRTESLDDKDQKGI